MDFKEYMKETSPQIIYARVKDIPVGTQKEHTSYKEKVVISFPLNFKKKIGKIIRVRKDEDDDNWYREITPHVSYNYFHKSWLTFDTDQELEL